MELCKIDESALSKDSELLQGKTVEQIKNETLASTSKIEILTVSIVETLRNSHFSDNYNAWVYDAYIHIPLPSGYSWSQIKLILGGKGNSSARQDRRDSNEWKVGEAKVASTWTFCMFVQK